jgi:quercetin dioxygenase-like cupin family protein
MSIVAGYRLEAMVGDPDDHRPGSAWALIVDPGGADPPIDDLAVIAEAIGPGDRIPLHVHRVSEVILVHGDGRFRFGEEEHVVRDGSVVFIPAGVAHGCHNTGDAPLRIEAVFPTTRVWMRPIERNPAPGTETDAPQAGAIYDLRTGDMTLDA